jgi:phytanoyl-CoA hydroxylase
MTGNTPAPDARGVEVSDSELPPAGLYDCSAVLTDGISGLAAVTDEHVALFRQQGFLVVHDAFSPEEVADALAGLVDLIQGRHPDFKGVMFEAKARDRIDTLQPEERQDYVRKIAWFVEYEPRLKALSHHPKLLAVLARLIGEEPALFQDMGLIKPPMIGREKPWHQDFAYFNLPLGTPVVGVWVALDEALIENGCMHVIPGSHWEGPVVHFQRRDWQICDTDVQVTRSVAIPLKPGGVLLFDGLLHHGTPPSQSRRRRRAVQYHYKPVSVMPYDDSAERLKIFGPEGKDVTC